MRNWTLKTLYAVRAIPVRLRDGTILGWARVDLLADGTSPRAVVYLADGRAYEQADAIELVSRDPDLLYATEDAAVQDGFTRLRAADARGELVPLPPSRPRHRRR